MLPKSENRKAAQSHDAKNDALVALDMEKSRTGLAMSSQQLENPAVTPSQVD
jgi:hypothetical protein